MANYQYQYGFPNFQQGYQQNQMNYQQGYQQPQMQQPQIQQPQVQNTGILYVEGDRGAEEFQMLPNTFAFLKSTDGKAVYFKQSLANGAVTCEKYMLGEMTPKQNDIDFVTRKEFEEFVRSLAVKENNYDEQSDADTEHPRSNERPSKLQKSNAKSRDYRCKTRSDEKTTGSVYE